MRISPFVAESPWGCQVILVVAMQIIGDATTTEEYYGEFHQPPGDTMDGEWQPLYQHNTKHYSVTFTSNFQ